ncbi:MAG TPA: pilus assembly protein PilN, partial [Gammaproteobacteria bacterium]|nr:pilus assembly protein PilN [Gammaproteobacteria bacterium]
MVNLKINLLPWRQKRRDRLQREFLNGLAAVGLVAVLLLVGAWRVYESAIDTQKARVAVIASEIEGLDARIAEIRVLQKKRKELLDRMRVIQELQGNR